MYRGRTTARRFPVVICLTAACLFLAWTPAHSAGGIAIVRTILSDNGDDDGYVDTETVTMRFEVWNTSDVALTGVTARLDTRDHQRVCIVSPTISIGDLAVGETKLTDEAFVFVLADVDRADPYEAFTLEFDVTATATPLNPTVHPRKIRLDLDLDVAGGSGPASYFESFESEMGSFEVLNLDAGKSSLAESDGYRCTYSDPDWINSNTYDSGVFADECYLANGMLHADAIFWGLSGPTFSPLGGRGFSGFHSLFFGIDHGPPNSWTTPLSVMEAAGTIDPIHLAWDGVAPVLSFKHQVSLIDSRVASLPENLSYDRGVVMAQLADANGDPRGPWYKIDPYQNGYDQQNAPHIFNCSFDPVDDGNTEDTFFDPADPNRKFGPSATCFPEFTFVNIGETSNPFDPGNLGLAHGPGMLGQWGIGTWIERSTFDLSRFRGRSIRLRYVYSAVKASGADDWEELFNLGANSGDDGWWIDDVSVTNALANRASAVIDVTDNSGLPGFPEELDPDDDMVCDSTDNCPLTSNPNQIDTDGDGAGMSCDCADNDPATYPGAEEINDGVDNQCAGDDGFGVKDEISGVAGFFNPGDRNEFSWPAQAGATMYRVARSNAPQFSFGCALLPSTAATSIVDSAPVASGVVQHYLVRSTQPNSGSWGQNSSSQSRIVLCN